MYDYEIYYNGIYYDCMILDDVILHYSIVIVSLL